MIEEWIKDPDRIGAFVMALVAIAAFYKGWICTGASKNAEIAALKTAFDETLKNKNIELDRALEEKAEFRAIVLRQIDVTNRALTSGEVLVQRIDELLISQRGKEGT